MIWLGNEWTCVNHSAWRCPKPLMLLDRTIIVPPAKAVAADTVVDNVSDRVVFVAEVGATRHSSIAKKRYRRKIRGLGEEPKVSRRIPVKQDASMSKTSFNSVADRECVVESIACPSKYFRFLYSGGVRELSRIGDQVATRSREECETKEIIEAD